MRNRRQAARDVRSGRQTAAAQEEMMEDVQEVDACVVAEGRRLLATAFETATAGDGLAGSGMAGAELLRRVRRRTRRQRRARALVPAGAVAALGGAAALAVTLTATVASAPSAFAAVSAAAAKTSAESFRVTMHGTSNELGSTSHWEVTGEFAPSRGVGEEAVNSGKITVLYVGKHIYQNVQNIPGAGKPWDEFKIWPMTATEIATSPQFGGEQAADPGVLLSLLKSAGTVIDEGPASGLGWTGTKYGFTVATPKDTQVATGTVDVDGKGQVRRLLETFTVAVGRGRHFTFTEDVTFSGFNIPVTVTVPPAGQVSVFNGYVLSPYGGF
jgi:hypothetical protein